MAPLDARIGARKFGLPIITFDDLRHTHATILLSNGVSLKVIQERLGHASVETTSKNYAHVRPEIARDAANVAERALGDPDIAVPSEDGRGPLEDVQGSIDLRQSGSREKSE